MITTLEGFGGVYANRKGTQLAECMVSQAGQPSTRDRTVNMASSGYKARPIL